MKLDKFKIKYEYFLEHLNEAHDVLEYLCNDLEEFLDKEFREGNESDSDTIRLDNNYLYLIEILDKIYKIAEMTNEINFFELED